LTHLDEIDHGLASRARQRIGDAWHSVVDAMYQKRAAELTFANLASTMAACAELVAQLTQSLKDD
jgi:hypothetical protein